MKSPKLKILLISIISVVAFSCNDSSDMKPEQTYNFDRAEMLEFWADDVIIPAFTVYINSLDSFQTKVNSFYDDPNEANLTQLRTAWLAAYLKWQNVSMFEIGKAEEIGLRNATNIYPTSVSLIESNINEGSYNLELPSNIPAQGFPALDYLLFGQATTDSEIITNLKLPNTKVYVIALVERMYALSKIVLQDWNQGFRDDFISNKGSSATASTDKMVNDFLFYYEKFLRAAKVGIPAGIFSGNEETDLVEGKYSKVYSKQLFEEGFNGVRNFFNGKSFDQNKDGPSLVQYLNEIRESNELSNNLGEEINMQWSLVNEALKNISPDFGMQVRDDNSKMLALYDELQKGVVLLKVDMLQALNIQVDFVDADGD